VCSEQGYLELNANQYHARTWASHKWREDHFSVRSAVSNTELHTGNRAVAKPEQPHDTFLTYKLEDLGNSDN